MGECVSIMRTSQEVTIKESKDYGVRTKYLRAVCLSILTDHFFAPLIGYREPQGAAVETTKTHNSFETTKTHTSFGSFSSFGKKSSEVPRLGRLFEKEVFVFGKPD